MKLGRQILQEKDRYLRVVQKVKRDFQAKTKKIGMFAKDLTMKNFIFQVNNLKNREYDLNQIIEDFNQKWGQSNSRAAKMELKDIDGPIQQSSLSQQYRSLPFKLDIPEKEFFKSLEEEFYKGIHHDLLSNQHLMEPHQKQKISYALFEDECVIFSKLLDELCLSKKEKQLLTEIPKKDKKGYFVDKFLESFLRYKKQDLVLSGATMQFVISKVVEPLFALLAAKNEYERIYSILLQIQIFRVYSESPVNKHSKSAVFSKKIKSKGMTSSQVFVKASIPAEQSSVSLRQWLCSLEKQSFGSAFASKEFWVMAFSKIFRSKNHNTSTNDSSLIEKSQVLGTSMAIYQTEPEGNKQLSLLEKIKKSSKKLMNLHNEEPDQPRQVTKTFSLESDLSESKSVNKSEQISEIDKEIVKELIIRNLLSCKAYLQSPGEFEFVLDSLDERLQEFHVRKMWGSLDVAKYFETEVKNLSLFCFQRQDLKTLKISNLIKHISIFD